MIAIGIAIPLTELQAAGALGSDPFAIQREDGTNLLREDGSNLDKEH